ncbi:DnaD domain protein [Ectobacillus sp. JY-23]|uniref:DnaD domain-containing protein n=1 Tax=Ectobacillus sp. JY-23 TaxID=2933872 RepID=UPI001FF40910|nr:DnaD domain protein [Ectobacillus sp. JY-23]UOY92319.1 DnaD domain protein [Ectobacillus sp. JY-23]
MAVYRLVQVSFWQDDFVLELTPEERYFYLYLLTCSKTTQCGIYSFPKRVAEMETGYNRETVDKLLDRFVAYGKVLYDAETKEVCVVNWIRYNPVNNVNVEKCVLRELKLVKSKALVQMFLEKCREEGCKMSLVFAHFCPGVSVPEEEDTSAVFRFYEEHFGSLSSYAAEELQAWITDLSSELVLKALQLAFEQNQRKLAYVKAILRDWHQQGYTKLQEVEEALTRFRQKAPASAEQTAYVSEEGNWEAPSDEELRRFLEEKNGTDGGRAHDEAGE